MTSPDVAWTVLEGDCAEILDSLDAESVAAIVTDPPYGIGFQRERWDGQAIREAAARSAEARMSDAEAYQAWTCAWATAALRVLKPGAHLVAFGAPRTAHRLACGLEEAGLDLRDTLIWLYGTACRSPESSLEGAPARSSRPTSRSCSLADRPRRRSGATSRPTAPAPSTPTRAASRGALPRQCRSLARAGLPAGGMRARLRRPAGGRLG